MKICLITFYNRYDEYPTKYSLAGLRIAEYIKSNDATVEIFPICLDTYHEFDVERILKGAYDAVGISYYAWYKDAVCYIADQLKNKIPVILGGPEVENVDVTTWDDEIFIVGEGEETFLQVCRNLVSNKGRISNEFVMKTPNVFTKNFPEYKKLFNPIQIKSPLLTEIKPDENDFLWYETCRGCDYNCGYCGHKTRDKTAYFELDVIEKEIQNIGDQKYKRVFVIDPNFAGNKARAKKVLSFFNKYAPQTSIGIYLRPEFLDDEMIELLTFANIDHVRIGIQTTNPNVPGWIRSNSIIHIKNQLPKLSENGIKWRAELITGLPGDNMRGLSSSVDFIESLNPTEYFAYHLSVIPGTPLYNILDKQEEDLWIGTDNFGNAKVSSSYSEQELKEMLDFADQKTRKYNRNHK